MANIYTYPVCKLFQSLQLRALLNHVYSVHSQKTNFKVVCNVFPSCKLSFTRYNTLYKHVVKHHHQFYCNNKNQQLETEYENANDEEGKEIDDNNSADITVGGHDTNMISTSSIDSCNASNSYENHSTDGRNKK